MTLPIIDWVAYRLPRRKQKSLLHRGGCVSRIVATAVTSSTAYCVAVGFLLEPLVHVKLCSQIVFLTLSLVSPVDRFFSFFLHTADHYRNRGYQRTLAAPFRKGLVLSVAVLLATSLSQKQLVRH